MWKVINFKGSGGKYSLTPEILYYSIEFVIMSSLLKLQENLQLKF